MKTQNCTFYIIRHGHTMWNARKLLQGQKNSPLTGLGIKQAKEIGKQFCKIKFTRIFSSDLLRAKRTAKIIALEHKMVVQTSKLLRERSFGPYEGKRAEVMRSELREQFAKHDVLSFKEQMGYRIHPKIETYEELVHRLITFIREISVAYPGKNILVVTHGAIMRILLIHLGYKTYKELSHEAVGNTGYIILESDGVDFFIKKVFGLEKRTF